MATGPLVGSGGDGSREKHRWTTENKVYTRKSFNKRSNPNFKPLQNPLSQTLATTPTIDGNSSQPQPLHRSGATSGDSSSLNRPVSGNTHEEPPPPPFGNGSVRPPAFTQVENRVTISLSSRSKQEIREIRQKLTNELNQVRNLLKKVESMETQITGCSGGGYGGYSQSQLSANDGMDNGNGNGVRVNLERVNLEVASKGPRPRPPHQLNVSVVENSHGGASDILEKEKRTPKVNQYYRNSDFVLGTEKFPPQENNKKLKSNGGERDYGVVLDKRTSQFFKNCDTLLSKLMKHKHGWVFNSPVDVDGLGLVDYYSIIKHPMDLGTVKSRLSKNWYKSPWEFAEDVRLTFRNAMTYNPKGQDVHIMADQLSNIFEERWAVILAEYNHNPRFVDHIAALPTPTHMTKQAPPPEFRRTLDRSESTSLPLDFKRNPSNYTPTGRVAAPKKPKAKDPHKREMTFDERRKLSTNLMNLPSDKLDNIVQIINRRNSAVSQHGDEIEVDIDSVDTETLWELDRFVTNYKKSLSKYKRKAELAIQARGEAKQNVQEMDQVTVAVEAPKENKTDEKKLSSSLPVQGERHGDNASRSSSSSTSSSDSGSSSSDSDSESSSAGSDAAHSPKG
ncbi:transcription factor GTE4-like [Tasmannia lanceolata]|uniref:transcription factor GTE4-like n=1 Tax=Tasmannia lanceolata TaxID=3420 RepID=UPI004064A45C